MPLAISNKVLYQQEEKELDNKLRSYIGNLKHDLLLDNGFRFNINIDAYLHKSLKAGFDLDVVKELEKVIDTAVEIYLNEDVKHYKAIQKAVMIIKGGRNET